ncbi:S8 family serine peptidase [Kibdelosporangium philippinense]|uniref:S8 family serine peptidase n=1 Tax=Kibdelosporangium philippinense TaxID=211113 RepID=A0ABS8Z3Q1_9PSEU|nr:S8 family serine peptidase [Kibdelosporangium philippinense]MCE7002102.1 S8 family serine peptidase [Kibdelosporangium philippinense]
MTGDVVTYTERNGGQTTLSIEAAPRSGPRPVFETSSSPDGYFVVPSDAAPYLASGAVDPELFDVKELVKEGLGDAASDKLPVIVSYDRNVPADAVTRQTDDLPGSDRTVTLPTVNAAAVRVKRTDANEFWRALAGEVGGDRAGKRALGGGVAKLRLDRKVKASLDKSVSQVGAPEAWKTGLDGQGVTVAVLDTGIDAQHPDLAGRIADSRNFTADPDTGDGYGHGTHVASIIAGSGAASGGKYRGVASGARLLNGKVLNHFGSGELSQVMAGMEWAVHAGARVVNMSLGGGPSAGDDVLSELVNKLTTETGALFVAAAGNSGGITAVETPAVASSALAVGAVDKSDRLAAFSARGPRLGDAMVKPEIVAPGVNIVAARAAGTNLGPVVGEKYTQLSGTSMATPHVAGAAALLAQKHPSWRSGELKALLTTSAKDVGASWYEQGSGRLNIPGMLADKVVGPSSVGFGRLSYPDGQIATTRTVTYTNVTERDVSLSLTASATVWTGGAAPGGVVSLDKSTVVVPAKGQATIGVRIDPTIGPAGAYGGLITAIDKTDGIAIRTPISFYDEAEHFPLTVKMTDSRGNAPPSRPLTVVRDDYDWANARNNDPFVPATFDMWLDNGTGTVSVPKGKYSTVASVVEPALDVRRATLMAAAAVAVDAPSTIALDARAAVPMQVETREPTDIRERYTAVRRYLPGAFTAFASGVLTSGSGWQTYITPSAAAGHGTVGSQDHLTLGQALVDLRVRAPQQLALHPLYDAVTIAGGLAGHRELQVVSVDSAKPADFQAAKDKVALVRLGVPAGINGADLPEHAVRAAQTAVAQARQAGAVATLTFLDMPGALPIQGVAHDAQPHLSLSSEEGARLRELSKRGDTTLSIAVRSKPEYMYNLYFRDRNGVPARHLNKVDPATLVAVDTRYHGDKPDTIFSKRWFALPTDTPSSVALNGTQFQGPSQWKEYIGPADDKVFWKRFVSQMAPGQGGAPDWSTTFNMLSEDVFRTAGTRPQERWFQAPIRGGAATHTYGAFPRLCSPCRSDTGDLLPDVHLKDSHRGHFIEPWQSGKYLSKVRVYRRGQEIPGQTSPLRVPLFRLDERPDIYRLEIDDEWPAKPVYGWPNGAINRLTPRVNTVATFRSAPPTGTMPPGYTCLGLWAKCAYQPVIQIDYQLGLDLLNQAPAGRVYTFDVVAGHHEGAQPAGRIIEFRLWYSTNDGRDWQRAQVVPREGGRYAVPIAHPALGQTNGFVSLHVEVLDSAGNRTDQTMQRAYALTENPVQ